MNDHQEKYLSTPTSNGVDIRVLARLARLDITNDELASFEKEIPDILSFVEKVGDVCNVEQKESCESERVAGTTNEHRNILREDKDPHEGGVYTETLLGAAPKTEGGRVKVKQVIKK